MKRIHSVAFDVCDYTEQLTVDIWSVINSYWALFELLDRWRIVTDTLCETKGVFFFCSPSELEILKSKERPLVKEYCLAEIDSFTWYNNQCIGVIHCKNVHIAVGQGRWSMWKRLNVILWHTESEQWDQFFAEQHDAVVNKEILSNLAKIDYGRLKPVENIVALPPLPPRNRDIWSTCCII
jgi:hypothetical protein